MKTILVDTTTRDFVYWEYDYKTFYKLNDAEWLGLKL
jgi:hypothetical protein